MSSIASVAQWSSVYGDAKVSEDLDLNQDYRVASTLGYGQSKHVAERLLYLGSQAGARTAVLRIGQIAGPVWEHIEPVWNAHEWFPSMIKSSISLGMAPDSLGALSWVDWFPVDSLARTIQELTISLSNASSEQFHVFNLVNPRGTPYKDLVGPLKDRLDLKIVSYKRWMDAIKDIDGSIPQNLRDFPSLKLLDFMESLSTASPLDMETGLVQACSRTMKDLRALSALDMDCWLTQWGF